MAISSCRPYAKQNPQKVLAAAQRSELLKRIHGSRMAPEKYFAALPQSKYFEINDLGIEMVRVLHQRAQVIADRSGLFKDRYPNVIEVVNRVTGEAQVDQATEKLRIDKLTISPNGCHAAFKLLMISTMRELAKWNCPERSALLGINAGEVYDVQEVFLQKDHQGLVMFGVGGARQDGSPECSVLGEPWSEPEFFFSRTKNPAEIEDFQSLLYTWQSSHALSYGLLYPMSGLARFANK